MLFPSCCSPLLGRHFSVSVFLMISFSSSFHNTTVFNSTHDSFIVKLHIAIYVHIYDSVLAVLLAALLPFHMTHLVNLELELRLSSEKKYLFMYGSIGKVYKNDARSLNTYICCTPVKAYKAN